MDTTDHAVKVRRGDARDIAVLAVLHRSTALHAYANIFPSDVAPPPLSQFIDDWTAQGLDQLTTQACFVATIDTAIVGVVVAGPDPHDVTRGHLSRLYVHPTHWDQGIGRLLHDRALSHLQQHHFLEASLWVLEANMRARRWYEHLGWRPTGDRQATYTPAGIDDVGYERTL